MSHIGYSLSINSKGSFICMHHPTYRITHTTAFVTPVVYKATKYKLITYYFEPTLELLKQILDQNKQG